MTPSDPPSYQPQGRRPPRRQVSQRRSVTSEPDDATKKARTAAASGADAAADAASRPSEARRATAQHAQRPQAPVRRSVRTGEVQAPGSARRQGAANASAAPAGAPGSTRRMPTNQTTGHAADAPSFPPSYAPSHAPASGARRPVDRDEALAAYRDSDQVHHRPGPKDRTDARPSGRATGAHPVPQRRSTSRGIVSRILVFLLVILVAWPVGLGLWANARLNHTEALPATPDTPGTTYLLAGSDSRADGAVADGTSGQRSDTIMLLHDPDSGPAALVSLPRDTYVTIPGHGPNKLNAAYSLGGPALLTQTVEELTGIGVDHYVEVGMGGVTNIVDAVDGVTLCLDQDVNDAFSGLQWSAGCHEVDGTTALQFARMRYSDPRGDIGRGERQRQVIAQVTDAVAAPRTLVDPVRQVQLVRAGTDALLTDPDTGIVDLAGMALDFRGATGPNGVVGAPPIASTDHHPGGLGSTVLLDEARAPQFWADLAAGRLTPQDAGTAP